MDKEEIIALYDNGCNPEDIADMLGIDDGTVLSVLEEAGVFDEY